MSDEYGGVCPLCGYAICDTFEGKPCSRMPVPVPTLKDNGVRSGRELFQNDGLLAETV